MLTLVLALELTLGQVPLDSPAKEKPYWLETARQHIDGCEVFFPRRPEGKLQAHAEPVFHHIQSTRARSVGSVFLFVEASGRPAAVGDVFLFPRNQKHDLYNEWHSLADEPLTVRWDGGPLMECPSAGLDWQSIPESTAPATGRTARERQLRQLARRFTAHLVNREGDKYELRLLTTPLYQFSTGDEEPEAAEKARCLGGGLFAFCQETDPEIFLLLEARRGETGSNWYWAAAEFSNLSLFLQLDGKAVWKADPPEFSSRGKHFGGKLKDVDLVAPPAKQP
jgi:hypothetical protein